MRNTKHRLVTEKVIIDDLRSSNSFDGRYFKIVSGKSDEAIKFNDENLALRACHVYFHLTKAKNYFLNNFENELTHLKRPRTLTIRIEMNLGFNNSSHFIHENLGTFYNNALTIPPSSRSKLEEVDPWYYEIWFAPKKKVKVKTAVERAADIAASGALTQQMVMGVVQSQITSIGSQLAQGYEMGALEGEYYLKSLLFSVGVTALVPQVIKLSSKAFKKTIYLDSAMIPEVIYHEYSHFALSPLLSLDKHSAVVEGVANYFAAMVGQTDGILKNTNGFSKGLLKVEAGKSQMYDYYMEDSEYAQLDFTFKFLYEIKDKLGEAGSTKLIFNSLKKIEGFPTLKYGLIPALFRSVEGDPVKTYKLHQITQDFGF